MNTPTIPLSQQKRLRAHFGFTGLPFRKNVTARTMFDSSSQRELRHGLVLWLELDGLALVTGPPGVGKSICLRRFVDDLPEDRFAVHRVGQIPTTPNGFLRALSRRLGLRPRLYGSDMFDALQGALQSHREERGTHPVFVLDDAEGMRVPTLDLVRRLTAAELDGQHHVSILLSGTDRLVRTLQDPRLEPLCGRFAYSHTLRGFGLEDARNYVRFHVDGAGGRRELFHDKAVTTIFHASSGLPRRINQLALQALVEAVVRGLDVIDEGLMKRVVHAHPLYRS